MLTLHHHSSIVLQQLQKYFVAKYKAYEWQNVHRSQKLQILRVKTNPAPLLLVCVLNLVECKVVNLADSKLCYHPQLDLWWKYDDLVDRDKDREKSLNNQLPLHAKQTQLREMNIIYCQLNTRTG